MRLEVYIMLLFSISLVFYILGLNPAGMTMLYNQQTGKFLDVGTILGSITSAILNGSSSTGPLTALGLAILASLAAAYFVGFSALYIIPIIILIGVLNYLTYPMALLVTNANDPVTMTWYVPFVVFMNLLEILTMWTAIRGGGN